MIMALYKKCPYCGANLDPCEKCDCGSEIDKINDDTLQLNSSQEKDVIEQNRPQATEQSSVIQGIGETSPTSRTAIGSQLPCLRV